MSVIPFPGSEPEDDENLQPSSGAQPSGDMEARRRIRESLDESLIVEASAGTGKTTELVRRIVAVLEAEKGQIENIVAVTFTNKAAGELKLRLREALDHRRQQEGANQEALNRALQHLEEATIGTIHAFCAQILRERPVEAKVDPSFAELNEAEANRLYASAFRAWLERRLNQPSPGLERAFARLAWRDSWDNTPPLDQLQWAGKNLIDWRDHPAKWRRESFAREEELRTLVRQAREVAEMSARPRRVTDPLYKGTLPVRLTVQGIERSQVAGQQPDPKQYDYDELEAQILKLGRDLRGNTRKGGGEYGGGVTREDLVDARDRLMVDIEGFRRRADADLAAQLREEMQDLLDEYELRKSRQGKLDFVDLLIRARDLIRDDAGVRRYLQQSISHLFIDEFQDTDPLQAEILLLLAADDPAQTHWRDITPVAGKLFLVGDPKQSIYKFRRADIHLYREVTEHLTSRGAGLVRLTKSFRAVPNIQAFVNAAFEPEMEGASEAASAHAAWAPLERFRDPIPGRPSVIALPVPKPYGRRISKQAVRASLPEAIAAYIDWLVNESGWDLKPEDVAVLFRRRRDWDTDWTREIARGLEARNVPHLLAGSKSFHRREEVQTLRAALTAIEWPDDELSVYAALKGSLFAIPDDALLLFKHRHGRLNPLRAGRLVSNAGEDAEGGAATSPEPDPRIVDALTLLAELHRKRNLRPFAVTVNALLEATRAYAGFLLRPGGNQILANVSRVADLARSYETSGGISFRGFVEELAEQAEKEEAAEAPVLEEDSSGVRLMTVHAAKGLEFRCVILADLPTSLSKSEPDQYVDADQQLYATRLLRCTPHELLDHAADEARKERAEGMRVAYVAATRARDLLVVPAVGDEPFPEEGWLSPLHKALYPAREDWRSAEPAEGCPKFGQRSIVDRPSDYDFVEEPSVRPGLIRPAEGAHEVVWWDPNLLRLGGEPDYGLRRQDLLKADDGSSAAAYQDWAERRVSAILNGAEPEFHVFTASEPGIDLPPGPEIPFEVLAAEAAPEPSARDARRYGTLVHAILRDARFTASAEDIEKLARLHAKILGAPVEEAEAARQAVAVALTHPLIQAARKSSRVHREYPIQLELPPVPSEEAGGSARPRLLEGILDLAYLETNPATGQPRWVIVDFKTSQELKTPGSQEASGEASAAAERYRAQLAWYAFALSELTAIPARTCLLPV